MSVVGIDTGFELGTTSAGPDEISRRLEAMPATRYVWKLVILLSLGGCFEIYDLFLTGYIAPGLSRSGLLTTTTQGFFGFSGIGAFVAATFAGLFVGTFFLGFLADRFGRRAIFTYALLGYTAASVIMACQTSSEGLLFWRFLAGIGIGVEVITIDAYITELVPSRIRGRAFAVNQSIMFVAVPVVAFLAWWLVPLAPYGIDGWRWVVLIGAGASMIIWVLRLFLPESPLWLARHGRTEEAFRILATLEGAGQRPPAGLAPALARPAMPPAARVGFADLFRPPYLSLVILFMVFNLCQAFGFYGFANWVPTLLVEKGINVTKSLQYAFIVAFAYPIAPLLASSFADKFERRWIITGACVAIIAFGMAFAQLTEPALLIVCGVLLTACNTTMSYAYHAYQTEVFPTQIRARASGLVYSMSRLSATFSGFIVAYML
ncbi:MFS transporter, partial [Bradyrhizobium sp. P5_C11_2]